MNLEGEERQKLIENGIIKQIYSEGGTFLERPFHILRHRVGDSISIRYRVSYEEIESTLDNLIKDGYIFRKTINDFENDYTLTSNGLKYAFTNNYISLEDIDKKILTLDKRSLDFLLSNQKNIDILKRELIDQKKEINEKIEEQKARIKKFYTDVISIMAILIAAFSIIGLNIGGVKFIVENHETLPLWEYVSSIAAINFCLVIALFFMMVFIKWIFKQERNRKK